MNVKEAFGTVLKQERQRIGITQLELAGRCDLDPLTISLYERGERQPTLATIFKLSGALNIRADHLVRQVMESLENGEAKP